MNRKTVATTPTLCNVGKTKTTLSMLELVNLIHEDVAAIKNQERLLAATLFGPDSDEGILPPNETNIESTLFSIYEYTKLIRSRMRENIEKLDVSIS